MEAALMFDAAAPFLERALARSHEGFSVADLRTEVEQGRALLWPGRNAAAVTYIRPMKAMHVWAAGGDLVELQAMAAECEKLSLQLGCDAIMAGGRPGWSRALGWTAYALKELRT